MTPTTPPAERHEVSERSNLDAIRIAECAGAAVVGIRGSIDAGAASMIRDVLGWAVHHHRRVVIDCSGVTQIDRHGLGLLISMQDRAHQREVDLCFTAVSSALTTGLRRLNAEAMFPVGRPGVGSGIDRPSRTGAGERRLDFFLPQPEPLCWPVNDSSPGVTP